MRAGKNKAKPAAATAAGAYLFRLVEVFPGAAITANDRIAADYKGANGSTCATCVIFKEAIAAFSAAPARPIDSADAASAGPGIRFCTRVSAVIRDDSTGWRSGRAAAAAGHGAAV
ncbi:hypothetical protein [Pollutimonas bauzanensis]|uniref:hypothetical protein n=1 Tax=Pollutimonas bauzanensis TaxID=658167 RepID=UPI0009332AF4|nr:hypothetical protein [Pollutimonas bauzanensis]